MAVTQIQMGPRRHLPCLISDGETEPEEGVQIPEGKRFVGFSLDDGFDGALINWYGSVNEGETYGVIEDWNGDALSTTVTEAVEERHYPAPFEFFEMFTHIKPTVPSQIGDTTLTLAFA